MLIRNQNWDCRSLDRGMSPRARIAWNNIVSKISRMFWRQTNTKVELRNSRVASQQSTPTSRQLWKRNIDILARVWFKRLHDKDFYINLLKYEFAVKETDWLGYWLIPTGLKSWKKKVDVILEMNCRHKVNDVQILAGVVNYYRDIWLSCAHIFQLQIYKTGNNQSKRPKYLLWIERVDKALKKMKSLLATDTLTN